MSKKILLVEHRLDEANQSRQVLQNLGYQVRLVQRGEQVPFQVSQFGPDLIVLAMDLPDLEATELCRNLKSNAHTRLIPIIIMGLDDTNPPARAVAAYEAGAEYYCNKDGQFNSTLSILTRLVFQKGMYRTGYNFISIHPVYVL